MLRPRFASTLTKIITCRCDCKTTPTDSWDDFWDEPDFSIYGNKNVILMKSVLEAHRYFVQFPLHSPHKVRSVEGKSSVQDNLNFSFHCAWITNTLSAIFTFGWFTTGESSLPPGLLLSLTHRALYNLPAPITMQDDDEGADVGKYWTYNPDVSRLKWKQ